MSQQLPIRESLCPTCPFRPGSPYADLVPELIESALTNGSRICHCTGSNAINRHTGKPEMLCRGARDMQLQILYLQGFLKTPTDEAWIAKCEELKVQPNQRGK